MRKGKVALVVLVLVLAATVFVGCESDADVASKNASKAAEQFEVPRKITFFNGITDSTILEIEGLCSIEAGETAVMGALEVTCKVGEDEDGDALVRKHFLGLSDNVSYLVEQTDAIGVSTTRHRVIIKPEIIVPNFDRP